MTSGPKHGGNDPDGDAGGTGVVTRTRSERKLQKPKLYRVLLHNDHYTTMEFVVAVLKTVFHRSDSDATAIMLHVHRNGLGVAGVYSYEIAESKVGKVRALAKAAEFPLLCTLEPE